MRSLRLSNGAPGAAVLFALITIACSSADVLQRIAPPEVDAFARAFLDTLRTGSDSAILARLTPTIQRLDGVRDSIAATRAQFPAATPDTVELVGGQVFFPSSDSVTRRALVYEVRTASQWAIANLIVLEELGVLVIDGVNIRRSPAPLATMHGFTLQGKKPAHVIMLILTLGVAAFSLGVAILVLRTPMRRRWLWAGLALVGAGKFGFNWTTGETFTQLLSVQLLGAGMYRVGLVGPWLMVVSFPAGALVALDRRRRALSASQVGDPSLNTDT